MITQELIVGLANYNADTGVLSWKKTRGGRFAGVSVGCVNKDGYLQTAINKKSVMVHRLIWLYVHGDMPKCQIDHINGIKTDNRLENLREADPVQNGQNRQRGQKNNKSGLLGVSRLGKKWRASISVSGKQVYLGSFDTPEKAHAVYLEAKRIHHPFGEMARHAA